MIQKIKRKIRFILSVNWYKTFYFNYKMLPFNIARKLPVFFFGKVRFSNLDGKLIINGPIKKAMIGFGQSFEFPTTSYGVAELSLSGTLVFNKAAHIGKDCVLSINKSGYCEFGYMATLGSKTKLICNEKIIIGEWTGVGYESQLIDTNSHPMKNIKTGEYYPINGSIVLGSHNAISNRVTIMLHTQTPDYCVIASNTLCNKDYTNLGEHVLIGGIPAKLLRENFSRDWENEKAQLKKYKRIL